MSKVKIYGNPNPVIGIKEYYSIHDFFGSSASSQTAEPQFQNTPDENIKWSVWILLGKSWVKMSKNNKTGATVDYTFTQISLKRKGIRMLVDANGEKAILDIKTKNTEERKILHVEILDWSKKKPAKLFSYGEKITARVHCLNMEKFPITVTLWEDDGGKKDLSDISIESKEVNVLNGKADVEFTFDPGKVWLANAKSEPNELNEGTFHEYYVTAEFYKKVSKPTENVNVINPDYKEDIFAKVPVSKPSEPEKKSPAAQKGPSKKETRGISKTDKKAHDYQEQKVVVKPTVVFNPQQEFINSLMMVDVGDSVWNKKKGSCACKENNFYWSKMLTCDERKKVLQVCAKLWGEDKKKDKASELMAVMHLETGEKNMFKPYADNGAGYSGLIQFSDAAARNLGTTRSALKKMTFIEQMDYVHDYFASKKEISNMVDLYLHVLKPNAVGNGNNPDYVLFDESISVPDGDGSQTSAEQRKINIGKEPWVTKYGYSSNPSFMKGDEHTQRKKWVYTRQRFEDRWGFINGKTTVADVHLELKQAHYNPGAKYLFTGVCENVEEENNNNTNDRAPWMKIAIDMAKEMKGCTEDKEPMYGNAKKFLKYCDNASEPTDGNNGAWCAAFMNWSIKQTRNDATKLPYKHKNSASSQAPLNDKNYVKISEPIYGSIVVYRSSNGKGHTGFLYGKTTKGEYILLGGNQDNTIRFDSYGEYTSNSKKKKLYGFYLPADYVVSDVDKLNDNDIYDNEDMINIKYGIVVEKSTGKTN
ncbi:hypothetical protein PQ462_08150 [Flavobacterium sp. KACC 22758]|uniref:hypothetical protein n=1 Tax=Flavobacterium sp. KACC 22758 TaxID=3025667 RepID=UPI0023653D08|nr:hypothetical protein [Flavobacterium sp. KACC 22758]WDF61335.1 hypothetical protein PQ462_08150 [Flavobacterium sp. KACC 22758]